MATDLALPAGLVPSNLHLPDTAQHMLVESDLYGIAERIKEIDENLHIFLLADDDKYSYAIMEHCRDGVERLVFKVKELDARVIEKLRELMAVPLQERIKRIDEMHHRLEQEERDADMEALYERMGRPMWTELERCGFIQRGVSYPKAGVATHGKKRR